MSENMLLEGYIVKLEKIGSDTKDELNKIDELHNNFDIDKTKVWQEFYDDSGYKCMIYITYSIYEFYDNYEHTVTLADLEKMRDDFMNATKDFSTVGNSIAYFTKIWHNCCEMGPIIEEKEDE